MQSQTKEQHKGLQQRNREACPPGFPPLASVTKDFVTTAQAAFYLMRSQRTLFNWVYQGKFPNGVEPKRINGRLLWPVAAIRRCLGGV